jgi:peptidoglycan hydrolase-like protein with peptidoglycan-binding domain
VAVHGGAGNRGRIEDEAPYREALAAAVEAAIEKLPEGAVAAAVAALLVVLAAGALAAERGGSTGGASVQRAGSTVVALQSALGIVADGIYGPQTRAAVRRFQRARGLVVDGIAGPVTLRALGIAGTTRTTASSRSSGATTLQRIAMCESGGNPTAVSSSGRYRGKYQFSMGTWRHLGGEGDPADAPEWLQDRMALRLYRLRGSSPWPNCP